MSSNLYLSRFPLKGGAESPKTAVWPDHHVASLPDVFIIFLFLSFHPTLKQHFTPPCKENQKFRKSRSPIFPVPCVKDDVTVVSWGVAMPTSYTEGTLYLQWKSKHLLPNWAKLNWDNTFSWKWPAVTAQGELLRPLVSYPQPLAAAAQCQLHIRHVFLLFVHHPPIEKIKIHEWILAIS